MVRLSNCIACQLAMFLFFEIFKPRISLYFIHRACVEWVLLFYDLMGFLCMAKHIIFMPRNGSMKCNVLSCSIRQDKTDREKIKMLQQSQQVCFSISKCIKPVA